MSYSQIQDDVSLVLNNSDLYVVEFISQGTFYRLNDPAFSHMTVEGYGTEQLQLSPHYRVLEDAARTTRAATVINEGTLYSAVNVFSNYPYARPTNRTMANAVLTMAIAVSESMRFTNITNHIYNNWSGFSLGRKLVTQTSQWHIFSEYATDSSHLRPQYLLEIHGLDPITRTTLFSILFVPLNCGQVSQFSKTLTSHPSQCLSLPSIHCINNSYHTTFDLVTNYL